MAGLGESSARARTAALRSPSPSTALCACASAGGQGGPGGEAEQVQEEPNVQGVDVAQVKRELINTWSNLVRALFATGRSVDLDAAHATLERQRDYLRSGHVHVRRRPSPPHASRCLRGARPVVDGRLATHLVSGGGRPGVRPCCD